MFFLSLSLLQILNGLEDSSLCFLTQCRGMLRWSIKVLVHMIPPSVWSLLGHNFTMFSNYFWVAM